MLSDDEPRIGRVLSECAEIPVDTDDDELAAIAIAVHVEEALELTLPHDLLDHDHLFSPAALEHTLRQVLGGL